MAIFCTIAIDQAEKWDQIVTSFKQYDVYYLSGYAKGFQMHGDGTPYLIYYESAELRVVNILMKRDIADFDPFKNVLPRGIYFDTVTPYGYGGFLFEGDQSLNSLEMFAQEYIQYMREHGIVSEFVRYHPILKNADIAKLIFPVSAEGRTIDIDITSQELIWNNFVPKNRNAIRKAINSGVEIKHGNGIELMKEFIPIYNATMDDNHALPYYYFKPEFYNSICVDLHGHYELFYAIMDDRIVSMSILLHANGLLHFHLSGSLKNYRYFAPSNLLIYKALCWGCEQGLRTAHLGGGVGIKEDDLFRFKHTFNRNAEACAYMGKNTYNKELYDFLLAKRSELDPMFQLKDDYFPSYRHM